MYKCTDRSQHSFLDPNQPIGLRMDPDNRLVKRAVLIPWDVALLNEARDKLGTIICRFCKAYGLELPRRYRSVARKDHMGLAKAKKHTCQKVRRAVRKQLGYVCCGIRYLVPHPARN